VCERARRNITYEPAKRGGTIEGGDDSSPGRDSYTVQNAQVGQGNGNFALGVPELGKKKEGRAWSPGREEAVE